MCESGTTYLALSGVIVEHALVEEGELLLDELGDLRTAGRRILNPCSRRLTLGSTEASRRLHNTGSSLLDGNFRVCASASDDGARARRHHAGCCRQHQSERERGNMQHKESFSW